MSIVPGFEHDVFISYAHYDNSRFDREGWVDLFHDRLRVRLTQLIGMSPDIWYDSRFKVHDQLIGEERRHLLSSATLVAILSPAYLNSRWCMEELSAFRLEGNLWVDGRSRIFKVMKTYVPRENEPPGLDEMLGYQFYEYEAETRRPREFEPESGPSRDMRYWKRLDDVAWDIQQQLVQMTKLPSTGIKPPEKITPPPQPTRVEQPESDSGVVQVTPPVKRDQVFISYSRKDIRWLERLQVHLKPLEQLGSVTRWDDTLIKPGDNWREEIREGLAAAKVAVLIISADFLASDFIMKNELPPILAAAQKEGATILPLIVSPCHFEGTASLSAFQAVNSPSQPLNVMTKARREAVLVKLVQAIESALRS